jgi:hypothetical protein
MSLEFPSSPNEDQLPPKEEPAPLENKEKKTPYLTLEQENEFDDLWIAAAARLGYRSENDTDLPGRILEKDGVTFKLRHYRTPSGVVKYHVLTIDTTGKPRNFSFDYTKKLTPKGVQSTLNKVLNEYRASVEPDEGISFENETVPLVGVAPTNESNSAEKQAAIAAYQRLIEQGMIDPFNLDTNNPEVKAAYELYYAWDKHMEQEKDAASNPGEAAWIEFQRTLFYLDAGFTDERYADDTLFDHAQQVLGNIAVEKPEGDEGPDTYLYPDVAQKMIDTIKYYHRKLLPDTKWKY